MAQPAVSDHSNHLLSSLSPADFGLLQPHLEALDLDLRQSLEDGNKPIKYAYFPESGFASVVATSAKRRQIEVGIIGRDGMSGINVVMGNDRSPHSTYMQVAGMGSTAIPKPNPNVSRVGTQNPEAACGPTESNDVHLDVRRPRRSLHSV